MRTATLERGRATRPEGSPGAPAEASHYRVTSRLESPEGAAVLVRDERELRCGHVISSWPVELSNSAALLLRSGSNRYPDSLANSSG